MNAKLGDLPWQAALRYGNSGKPFCGATLISKKWAVSAAHCKIQVGQQILLGANDISKANEGKLAAAEKQCTTAPFISRLSKILLLSTNITRK